MGGGSSCFNCCWDLADQLTCSPLAKICVWADLTLLGFVDKLAWAWLTIQMSSFAIGDAHGFS